MFVAGAGLAVLVGGTATGVAVAATGDDRPLTGSALERATSAALEHTGGGRVIETDVGDDGAAYGVEVRLRDGRVLEVSLDDNFVVTGTEEDDDGTDGKDEEDDERGDDQAG